MASPILTSCNVKNNSEEFFSPPIKLRRTSKIGKVNSEDVTVVSQSGNSSCSSLSSESEGVSDSSNRNSMNGYERTRRVYNLTTNLMPRCVDLSAILDNVSSLNDNVSGDTIHDSPPYSVNSYSIQKLMSYSEEELQIKGLKRKNQASSDYDSSPTLGAKVRLLSEDIYFNSRLFSDFKNEERHKVYEMEPMFNGYQLVGDSQLLRFSQCILGMPRKIDSKGKGWLGFCVGGQRICDLHRRVLDGIIPMAKKLIVLIGTNDLLKGTPAAEMCEGLKSLLVTLYQTAEKIVVLTLPPVPKLSYLCDHWFKLKKYNDFIFSLKNYFEEKLVVIDISQIFYQPSLKKCHLGLFELWFDCPVKRADLIHINKAGFKLIRDLLLKEV